MKCSLRHGLFFVLSPGVLACTSPNGALEGETDEGAAPGSVADAADATAGSGAVDARKSSADAHVFDAAEARPDADVDVVDAAPMPDATQGPNIVFYVSTRTSPFPHTDGLAGQTARLAFQGIRSFSLLRDAEDAHPVVVLDLGNNPVEAGYNDGNTTLIGAAPLAGLPPGHYTIGRSKVTHSRYRIDATIHVGGLVVPGEFENVQVLTDDTRVDGVSRPQGWFRYIFRAAGREFPLEGLNAPLPTSPDTGGFRLVVQGGEAYYDYPIDVTIHEIPPGSADLRLVLEVNMDHSFRWEDLALPGYTAGTFDSTPAGSEPVRRFGANHMSIGRE